MLWFFSMLAGRLLQTVNLGSAEGLQRLTNLKSRAVAQSQCLFYEKIKIKGSIGMKLVLMRWWERLAEAMEIKFCGKFRLDLTQ